VDDASPRRVARRLTSTAVYAAGPVAILAVVWLQREGLIAATPLWILVAIILAAGIVNLVGTAWLLQKPDSQVRLQARIAASVLTTGAVIYLAGWGSVLLIGFALGSAELLRVIGPVSTRPNMAWNWVAILAGETAVALGWAPTMIPVGLGHAIAITGGVCLTILTDVLGRSARAAAAAEDEVRERSKYFEDLVERAADIIGVIGVDGSVTSVSPAVERVLGYTPEQVEGHPIAEFLDARQIDGLDPLLRKVVAERGTPTTIEIVLSHRDGSTRTLIATLTCANERWGEHIIINLHDVTTQRELEDLLRHDARHDHLTGLLNRAAFGEVAARAASTAARHEHSIGMLYIDLDGFKQINDSLGHETGDRVLIETAARLAGCVGDGAVVARLGGDEFAVLVRTVERPADVVAIAERILDAVSLPIPSLRDDVRVGASIGIAIRDTSGIEISTLMRDADEAMYSAKRNGRSRWELCDPPA
jgi:diguanylate cyclase (GGDEF)-like protein/PAS domain S-box-containing protein